MVKCPADGCEMEERNVDVVDTVVLDSCPKCDGVWMDRGELKRVSKDELIEHKLAEKNEGSRMCPRCRQYMRRAELNGVILDECSCGIYFDKGEVDRVVGKKIVLNSRDDIHTLGVTVPQMQELLHNGILKVDSVELRLIRAKDGNTD
ncbi:MAG: zf-TFIIB domain-containing protein [Candidatus Altiarchaeota archaeon]